MWSFHGGYYISDGGPILSFSLSRGLQWIYPGKDIYIPEPFCELNSTIAPLVEQKSKFLAMTTIDAGAQNIGARTIRTRRIGARTIGAPPIGARIIGALTIGAPTIGARTIGAPTIGARTTGTRTYGAPTIGTRLIPTICTPTTAAY